MPEPVSQLKNYSTDPPGVTIGTANTKHKYGNNARRYRLHLANANNERNMHTPDCQRAPQRSRQNSHNEHHHRHYAAGAYGNKPRNLPPVRLCGVHEYVPEMTTRTRHMCHPLNYRHSSIHVHNTWPRSKKTPSARPSSIASDDTGTCTPLRRPCSTSGARRMPCGELCRHGPRFPTHRWGS